MKETNIFNSFDEISAKQWKQKIQMDLKGADYNKTLLTKTLEGISIQPFYHQDTYKTLSIPKPIRKASICQTFFIYDEKIVNKLIKNSLLKGADSIRLMANTTFNHKLVLADLSNTTELLLFCNFIDTIFFKELISDSKNMNLKIIIDPINHFSLNGNWFNSQKDDFNAALNLSANNVSLGINSSLYQNSGANIVQQISYSLAHANEYLNAFEGKDSTLNLTFTFAFGGNYFFEISKIRAFKYLINELISKYSFPVDYTIFIEPTLRNKTLYDYNVNMLRTTTESMSALLSGAEFISNVAYDSIYHKSHEFGERIARNQLLILKEESYFNTDIDISKGSYYIEQLTYDIADKSLTLFKDMEKNGGLIQQLIKGTIQRKIEESAQKEQSQFDKGDLILLGTNKYPNPNDKMKDELELFPFIKIKHRKTVIKPLIPRRLAEKIEQERIDLE